MYISMHPYKQTNLLSSAARAFYQSICPSLPDQKCRQISYYYGLSLPVSIVPLRNSMLDAVPPLATHHGTRLTAVLSPTHRYVLVLGIWEDRPIPLDGMEI
jgi:hypothetical protein